MVAAKRRTNGITVVETYNLLGDPALRLRGAGMFTAQAPSSSHP